MAQGIIKSKVSKPRRKTAALGPKKGARVIPPRKAVLVRQNMTTKKLSAGLTAMTEQTLGKKAGHLELLNGRSKNTEKARNGIQDKLKKSHSFKETEQQKGGSKKFG
ncbi:UPF0390 protein [Erysiphe neolycopersici]|uniref:UPF0390 protein n=1 Tax=Erysiphe neolycopersici TaxID=212602 RepID=A0A420HJ80_9PEZI|nr:UPF0390 protein [Erysiphe neolycopersici]